MNMDDYGHIEMAIGMTIMTGIMFLPLPFFDVVSWKGYAGSMIIYFFCVAVVWKYWPGDPKPRKRY